MSMSIDLASRLASVITVQQDILAVISDPDRVMDVAVTRTPELTGGSGAVIEVAEGEEMVYRAATGTAAKQLGLRLPLLGTLSGQSVRERAVLRSDDTESDPRVDGAACRKVGLRSMIVAPLIHRDAAIGVLKTYSAVPKAFTDLDSYVLQLLAGMVSAALMHAREHRDRIASEERYRLLFEKNVAGVFRSTFDGRLLDCNDAMVEALGYSTREELLGHATWDLYFQRSDREALLAMLRELPAARNVRIMLKRKDGTSLRSVVNVAIIAGDGDESQILGTLVEE